MELTKEDILKIASLARIEITGEEKIEKFRKEVSLVLDYVKELIELNTDGLEEVSQVTGLVNVQREDVPVVAKNLDAILNQAPEIKDRYFKVKTIL